MYIDYNRKDCAPEETIKKIKKILKKNKISINTSKTKNINNNIFSTRVELKNIHGIGTNGKGITKKYAEASAYAEFMERLQSKNLIKDKFLCKEYKEIYNDEEKLEYEKFIELYPEILNNNNLKKLIENREEYRKITQFYDLLNKQKIDLPIKIINITTHSNGLCAGNSKQEALVQGICEILERFAYKEFMYKKIKIQTINIKNINNMEIFNQLNSIEKIGLKYKLKDFSIGGLFPVVGIIIYDELKQNYLFSIGSDPNFDIAVQRCITEIFQGLTVEELRKKMQPVNNNFEKLEKEIGKDFIKYNWLKSYTSNSGIHPQELFTTNKEVDIEELPFRKVYNNIDALNYLLKILSENNYKVYCKNYSFLGFDTYKVFIPNMSEVDDVDDLRLNIFLNENKLNKIYFDSFAEMDKETEKLFINLSNSIIYNKLNLPYNVFGVNNYISNSYVQLNFMYLTIVKLALYKKYDEIKRIIKYKIQEENLNTYEKEYLSCMVDTINNKNLNKYSNDVKKEIKIFLFDTRKLIEKLHAPICPNCNKCFSKKTCKLNDWKKINRILHEKNTM